MNPANYPGEVITKLRELEEFVLADVSERPQSVEWAQRFVARSADLELAIRDFAAEYFATRAALLACREDVLTLSRNRDDIAIANAELALVVATAIQWSNGRASDDELRASVRALLDEPKVGEVAKRLVHEEPSA